MDKVSRWRRLLVVDRRQVDGRDDGVMSLSELNVGNHVVMQSWRFMRFVDRDVVLSLLWLVLLRLLLTAALRSWNDLLRLMLLLLLFLRLLALVGGSGLRWRFLLWLLFLLFLRSLSFL